MQEIYEFLQDCEVYFLSTVDGDKPKVRPFHTIILYEDKFYIQTDKTKKVAKQIKNNPAVELCAINGDNWLRVCGTLKKDEDMHVKECMLENYPDVAQKFAVTDKNLELLYFKKGKAIFYNLDEELKTIKF